MTTADKLTRHQLELLAWVAIAGGIRSGAHTKTHLAIIELLEFRDAAHYRATGRWYELTPQAVELVAHVELWLAHRQLEDDGWRHVGGGRRNSLRYERRGPPDKPGCWVLELGSNGSGWWGWRSINDHRAGPDFTTAQHVRPAEGPPQLELVTDGD